MSSFGRIPSSHFNALALDPLVRGEAYREFAKDLVDITPLRKRSSDIHFSWDAWHLEDVFVYNFVDDLLLAQRTKKHIDRSRGYLSIRIYNKGRSRGLLGDQICQTGEGNIHVMDFSLERYGTDVDTIVDGLYVPQAAVGYDPRRHPASFNIAVDSPLGRTLSFAIKSVLNDLPEMNLEQGREVKVRIIALLRAVFLQNDLDEEGIAAFEDARKGALKLYIDTQLSDKMLSVERICQTFSLSRSTLFRIFSDTGGVEAYIRERRTDYAFRDLLYAPQARGMIRKIAESWCFNSTSHLHRHFRAQYGVQPSDVLGYAADGIELSDKTLIKPSWYHAR